MVFDAWLSFAARVSVIAAASKRPDIINAREDVLASFDAPAHAGPALVHLVGGFDDAGTDPLGLESRVAHAAPVLAEEPELAFENRDRRLCRRLEIAYRPDDLPMAASRKTARCFQSVAGQQP